MSVLEAPQTWIAAAAVLVVVAVVLIALAPRRRRNAVVGPSAAAGSPATASAPGDDAITTPVGPIATPLDGGADAGHDPASHRSAEWFRPDRDADPDRDGHPDRAPQVAADDDVTGETVPAATDPRGTDVAEDYPDDRSTATGTGTATVVDTVARPHPARPSPRYVAVSDPARTGDRAKDRLLAVLLADPDGAVDVVAAMSEDGEASGTAAASLLRAGLTPRQVAVLCGVDEGALATLVARDLGLLARSLRDQDGRSRTEEPGRAWASAGSEPVSTTPTTG